MFNIFALRRPINITKRITSKLESQKRYYLSKSNVTNYSKSTNDDLSKLAYDNETKKYNKKIMATIAIGGTIGCIFGIGLDQMFPEGAPSAIPPMTIVGIIYSPIIWLPMPWPFILLFCIIGIPMASGGSF